MVHNHTCFYLNDSPVTIVGLVNHESKYKSVLVLTVNIEHVMV